MRAAALSAVLMVAASNPAGAAGIDSLQRAMMHGAEALCAATPTVTAAKASHAGNSVFDAVLNAPMRGSLAALQIGGSLAGKAQ